MKALLSVILVGLVTLRPALAADLEPLLKLYRDYGMPLPAKGARLVEYSYGGISIVNGVEQKPEQRLAFLLNDDQKSMLLLIGPILKRIKKDEIAWKFVPPDSVEPDKMEMESFGLSVFEVNTRLAVSLQLHAVGERRLADAFFSGSLTQDCGHHFSAFYQPAGLSAEQAVAHLAWAWLANRLLDHDSSRSELLQSAKKVLAAAPKLQDARSRFFMDSLEASLAPSASTPGSIDALIDGLMEVAQNSWRSDDFDPKVEAILAHGFDAIPKLLSHLDDSRVTRSVQQGFNNFASWHRQVRHVVTDILQGLAGEDFGRNWLKAQGGYTIERHKAEDWWNRTKQIPEKDYLQKHALDGNGEWPNRTMLRVLRLKYPEALAPLYREVVDKHPKKISHQLAEELAKSNRPAEEKHAAFLYAVTNANDQVKHTALQHINESDPKVFNRFVLQSLTNMAPTPKGEYWKCPEANLAHLVLMTDSADVWAAFLHAAKRADVGLRMELMQRLNYLYVGDRLLKQRLQLQAAFLDDHTERDAASDTARFTGPFAGFTFPKLRVCDLAAEMAGSLLRFEEEPRPSWTKDEWDNYRARVKKELPAKVGELR